MGTTVKYPPRRRPDTHEENPSFEEQRRDHPAEENPYESSAALTGRAGIASRGPMRPRLPSVSEFDFDEACGTKDIARKFAPQNRHGSPNHDRWNFPEGKKQSSARGDSDWLPPSRDGATRRGNARGLFWSSCTTIFIVLVAPAIFGFVQPLTDLLPARIGSFGADVSSSSDVSDGQNLDRSATTTASETIVVAENTSTPGKNVLPLAQSTAAAEPNGFATDPISSFEPEGIPENVEQPYLPETVPEHSLELRATIEPGQANSVEPQIDAETAPTPEADAPEISAPAPLIETVPAILPNKKPENPPQMAQSQQTVNVNPSQFEQAPSAIMERPNPAPTPPVMSPLSVAQIDRLLARGEELLRSGDIASARLLFQRVAAAGDRRGARGVGMTYDPRVYARLLVTGLKPDREQAEIWYEKAGVDPTFTIDLNPSDPSQANVDTQDAAAAWTEACARKYKSFDPDTGLFTALSGVKRKCRLP